MALLLLYQRLAKRHVRFAEVASSVILLRAADAALPARLYSSAHLAVIAVQVVGCIWIGKLLPAWETR